MPSSDLKNKKLTRKEREQRRRRREILAAAGRLFSAHGFSEVGIKDIAAEAECAIGTLYKFFSGKDAIYAALIEDLLERGREEMDEILAGTDDEREMLRLWVDFKRRFFHENLPLIRLIHSEVGIAGANGLVGLCPAIRPQLEEKLDRLSAIFESGIAKGRFASIARPRTLALALDSLTTAQLMDVVEDERGPEAVPDPETWLDPDEILRIFFASLLVS